MTCQCSECPCENPATVKLSTSSSRSRSSIIAKLQKLLNNQSRWFCNSCIAKRHGNMWIKSIIENTKAQDARTVRVKNEWT